MFYLLSIMPVYLHTYLKNMFIFNKLAELRKKHDLVMGGKKWKYSNKRKE